MGRLEKNLPDIGVSRSKGLECGEGVSMCGPEAGNWLRTVWRSNRSRTESEDSSPHIRAGGLEESSQVCSLMAEH